MTRNLKTPRWNPDYFYNIVGDHYADLNILLVQKSLLSASYAVYPKRPQKKFFESAESFDVEANKLISTLIDFLNQYSKGGRITILKEVWSYLVFQEKSHIDLGSLDGLDNYYTQLKSRIKSYEISDQTARSMIGLVQKFLIHNGVLSKHRYYRFKKKAHHTDDHQSQFSSYSDKEFNNIVNLLMGLYEAYDATINEHIKAWSSGYRNQFISEISLPPIRMSLTDEKNEVVSRDVILGTCKLNNFFSISLLIFALFTWGNTTPITQLRRDQIKLNQDGSVDTDYLLKGRGFRFVHLTIGKSQIKGSRSGYKWFNRYLTTRRKIAGYIEDTNGTAQESCNYLFPYYQSTTSNQGKTRQNIQWKSFTNRPNALYGDGGIAGPWKKVKKAFEKNIPKPLVPRFRKTAEQMTDAIVRCPFTLMEKSQHSWGTYRKSYAESNPRTALKNVAKALDKLASEGISSMVKFRERQEIASNIGLVMFDGSKSETTAPRLPNGLGCQVKEPPTDIEKKYLHHQNHLGRSPKVCADLSNCVHCSKSCIIDTVESVYNLLSFQECIKYGKPTWIGSPNAKERFEEILAQIELRLSLVSPNVLNRAKLKLKRHGLAGPWTIT